MQKILPLFFIFSAVAFSACNELKAEPAYVFIKSPIDKSAENFIRKIDKGRINLTISSPGGNTEAAANIAQTLMEKNTDLVIRDYCLSACAEFIIPAASKVTFADNPIIGFHWGPVMDYNNALKLNDNTASCHNEAIRQKNIFMKRGLNENFWQETEARLKLLEYKLIDRGKKCPLKYRKFENDFWLPTSKQLQQLWGLEFSGETCADDFETCQTKTDKFFPFGKRIIIGDKLYISKGKPKKARISCDFAKKEIAKFKQKNDTSLTKTEKQQILTAMEKVKIAACD